MDESNEIYEKVVSILGEGVKPLDQLYEEKGVTFTVEDVGTIAETFFALYNKIIDYYKELKNEKTGKSTGKSRMPWENEMRRI